jgi:hypothetical protein
VQELLLQATRLLYNVGSHRLQPLPAEPSVFTRAVTSAMRDDLGSVLALQTQPNTQLRDAAKRLVCVFPLGRQAQQGQRIASEGLTAEQELSFQRRRAHLAAMVMPAEPQLTSKTVAR